MVSGYGLIAVRVQAFLFSSRHSSMDVRSAGVHHSCTPAEPHHKRRLRKPLVPQQSKTYISFKKAAFLISGSCFFTSLTNCTEK